MSDINITAMVKGDEHYIILWNDGQARDAIRAACKWAINDELSFTEQDAIALGVRIAMQGKYAPDNTNRNPS